MEDVNLTEVNRDKIRLFGRGKKRENHFKIVPIKLYPGDPGTDKITDEDRAKVKKLATALKAVISPDLWTVDLKVSWNDVEKLADNVCNYTMEISFGGIFLQELYKVYLAGVPDASHVGGVLCGCYSVTSFGNEESTRFYFDFPVGRLREEGWVTAIIPIEDMKVDDTVWEAQLILDGNAFSRLEETLTTDFLNSWKTMKKQKGDFTLVTEDGTRIPCLKKDLKESESAVLEKMAKHPSKEATLEGMSAESINALLEFLHFGLLFWAKVDAHLALELFQAARLYELPMLEEEIKAHLLAMEPNMFDGKLALEFYKYVKGYYEGRDEQVLKNKVIKILKSLMRSQALDLTSAKLLSSLGSEAASEIAMSLLQLD